MARLFGNYNKPGPGVGRGDVRGYGFLKYFEIYFRKFWSLAYVNLLYLIFFIPVVLMCFGLVQLADHLGYGSNIVVLMLCFLPTILLAPGNAGLTKITRDFGREEPCFIWQDFWESAKVNLKQSFAVSVIGWLGVSIFAMVIIFYHGLMSGSFLSMLPFALAIVLACLFVMSLFYLQLMVVTLDLKMKSMIKNAWLLTLGALGKNVLMLLITALFAGLYALLFYFALGQLGALILLVVMTAMIICALISYSINYILFRVISQYIIEPYYRANPDKTADGLLARSEIKGEDAPPEEEEERELPEYVYENGRMVHRSVAQAHSIFEDKGKNDKK